jgi:hypothetical protein
MGLIGMRIERNLLVERQVVTSGTWRTESWHDLQTAVSRELEEIVLGFKT